MKVEPIAFPRSVAALAKQYRKFFGATVVAVLLLQLTMVTDTILVGRILGPLPMSGVRVASPVVNLLNVCAMLIGVGSSSLISVAMGKRRPHEANRAFTLALVLCLAVGLLFVVTIAPFAGPIARLISTSEESVAYTESFLRIVGIASPAYVFTAAMAMLLRTDGCIRLSSVVLAAAGISNVAFDLLYMGVLGMGIEGSALATDSGMLVGTLLSLLYFRWPRRTLRLAWRQEGGQEGPGLLASAVAIFKGGAPSALRMFLSSIALLYLNYVVGGIEGAEGITVLTVCGSVQLLATTFFSAGGQAATPLEGVLYGEGDVHGLRMLVAYVLRVVLVLVLGVALLVCVFPDQIYALFVPQGGAQGAGTCLRVYALGFAPLAVNYVLMYYYSTIGRRGIALVLSVCENCVFYLPLIWLLANAFGLVGAVAAYALTEALTLAAVLLMARMTAARLGLDNVLLLPAESADQVFEATVPARGDAPARMARETKAALDKSGVGAVAALRTSVAVEEMLANAALHAGDGASAVLFDVRVSARPTLVRVSLRDTGAPFDPTTYEADEDEYAVDGIKLLRSLATNVSYAYVLGMNQTIIEIGRELPKSPAPPPAAGE